MHCTTAITDRRKERLLFVGIGSQPCCQFERTTGISISSLIGIVVGGDQSVADMGITADLGEDRIARP
jgi:hypothetical protein